MIEMSVLIIALAFLILVIYAIRTLRAARSSLDQANQSLARMQQQMNEISTETLKLVQQTSQVTLEVHNKIKSVDALFLSFHQIGEAIQDVTSCVKQVSAAVSQSLVNQVHQAVHRHKNNVAEVTEWTALAISLWQKWQAQRNSDSSCAESKSMKEGDGEHVG